MIVRCSVYTTCNSAKEGVLASPEWMLLVLMCFWVWAAAELSIMQRGRPDCEEKPSRHYSVRPKQGAKIRE